MMRRPAIALLAIVPLLVLAGCTGESIPSSVIACPKGWVDTKATEKVPAALLKSAHVDDYPAPSCFTVQKEGERTEYDALYLFADRDPKQDATRIGQALRRAGFVKEPQEVPTWRDKGHDVTVSLVSEKLDAETTKHAKLPDGTGVLTVTIDAPAS